jgi:hypothetical protein
MAEDKLKSDQVSDSVSISKQSEKAEQKERREIKGNLPYTPYPGSLKTVLDSIIVAERPDKFSTNFLETVLKQTGGGARSVPPLLKKMGFLEGDGTPTDRYSRFKTDSKRAQAAAEGLRAAFSELFRRNEYIDKATEENIKDLIVEVTGLPKTDNIIRLIYNSFDVVRSFVPAEMRGNLRPENSQPEEGQVTPHDDSRDSHGPSVKKLGISYQINIVLPETDDPMVFDAIFKSLKRNLL